MMWVRSWPSPSEWAEKVPKDAQYVVDNLPKLVMAGQNYKTVSEINSLGTGNGWPETVPGFCMLEYDVALDSHGQSAFAALALVEPHQVLVAPYRWHGSWIHFVGNDGRGPTPESRPVHQTDEYVDSFGLGCIYIPRLILCEFLAQMNHLGFTDMTFGLWYRQKYGPARVTWAVHPQHVHYYPPV